MVCSRFLQYRKCEHEANFSCNKKLHFHMLPLETFEGIESFTVVIYRISLKLVLEIADNSFIIRGS